jgi:hypothetical protein
VILGDFWSSQNPGEFPFFTTHFNCTLRALDQGSGDLEEEVRNMGCAVGGIWDRGTDRCGTVVGAAVSKNAA